MDERRQAVRLSESLRITYKLANQKSRHQIASVIDDISGVGLKFPSIQKLQPGMVLQLWINFGRTIVPALAEVAWIKDRKDARFPHTMGIKFTKIDPLGLKKIVAYIRNRTEKGKTSGLEIVD